LAFTRFHARCMFSRANACSSRSRPAPSASCRGSAVSSLVISGKASPSHSMIRPAVRASDAVQYSSTSRLTLLLVQPFVPCWRLLWPLLTSRSVLPRRPFRHKARSPRVRTHSFTAQPPDIRHFALATRALRLLARSPCSAAPRIRFLFIGSRFTLHASSPRSVTLTQLRFTSFAVASLREDFHLRVRPCRRKKPAQGGLTVRACKPA